MRLALTACICMFATAAPALAEPGNTATGSTGTVQVGTVTANPSATLGSSAGGATAAAPSGSTTNDTGGRNRASRSTGTVQTSPTSLNPAARASHGSTAVGVRLPVGIGAGNNNTSGSTGTVQAGGGNTASSSTGTAQVSGTRVAPSATATPTGGDTSSIGGTIGIEGSGNSASDSTGTAQIGGGNAAMGSVGSAQSASPEVSPTQELVDPLAPSSLNGILSLPPTASPESAAAGSPPSARSLASADATPAVESQGITSPTRVNTQGRPRDVSVAGARQSIAERIVAEALPFTGLALLAWVLAGLLSVVTGVALRGRGARLT